jgi:hypothetical protein
VFIIFFPADAQDSASVSEMYGPIISVSTRSLARSLIIECPHVGETIPASRARNHFSRSLGLHFSSATCQRTKAERRQIYSFNVSVWPIHNPTHHHHRRRHRFEHRRRQKSFFSFPFSLACSVIKRLTFFTILNIISFLRTRRPVPVARLFVLMKMKRIFRAFFPSSSHRRRSIPSHDCPVHEALCEKSVMLI